MVRFPEPSTTTPLLVVGTITPPRVVEVAADTVAVGVAHVPSPRRNVVEDATPLPARRAVENTPVVICEAASDSASDPPLAWLLACAVGVRASLNLLSLPWQNCPADVPNAPTVSTPLVVVMIGSPLVVPIAPALVRFPSDDSVASDPSPLTAPAEMAMAVEPAALSRPAASTVNVATLDAEP